MSCGSTHPTDRRGRALPEAAWPDRTAAPDGLDLVRSFLNSTNLETGADRFLDADGLDRWLVANGLGPVAADEAERQAIIGLREALRRFVVGGEASAAGLAARLPPIDIGFAIDDGVPILHTPSSGLLGLRSHLALALTRAGAAGTLSRLKVCHNPRCRWAYYDRSRNRGRMWCSMSACGGRIKAKAYRRRSTGTG